MNEIVNNENDIIYFYSSDTIQAINESEPINFFSQHLFSMLVFFQIRQMTKQAYISSSVIFIRIWILLLRSVFFYRLFQIFHEL